MAQPIKKINGINQTGAIFDEYYANGDNFGDKLASSTNVQNCQSCGWHHVGLEIIKGNYYECPVTKLIGEVYNPLDYERPVFNEVEVYKPLEGGEKNEKGTES